MTTMPETATPSHKPASPLSSLAERMAEEAARRAHDYGAGFTKPRPLPESARPVAIPGCAG
jgi:hypothetical protein